MPWEGTAGVPADCAAWHNQVQAVQLCHPGLQHAVCSSQCRSTHLALSRISRTLRGCCWDVSPPSCPGPLRIKLGPTLRGGQLTVKGSIGKMACPATLHIGCSRMRHITGCAGHLRYAASSVLHIPSESTPSFLAHVQQGDICGSWGVLGAAQHPAEASIDCVERTQQVEGMTDHAFG